MWTYQVLSLHSMMEYRCFTILPNILSSIIPILSWIFYIILLFTNSHSEIKVWRYANKEKIKRFHLDFTMSIQVVFVGKGYLFAKEL